MNREAGGLEKRRMVYSPKSHTEYNSDT